MVAKIRPWLVLSIPADELTDRALTMLVPHTTSTRGSRFEAPSDIDFLKADSFDTQNLNTIPTFMLVRRMGIVPEDLMKEVERAVKSRLGLDSEF